MLVSDFKAILRIFFLGLARLDHLCFVFSFFFFFFFSFLPKVLLVLSMILSDDDDAQPNNRNKIYFSNKTRQSSAISWPRACHGALAFENPLDGFSCCFTVLLLLCVVDSFYKDYTPISVPVWFHYDRTATIGRLSCAGYGQV